MARYILCFLSAFFASASLLLVVVGVPSETERHQVLTVTPRTEDDVQMLHLLQTKPNLEVSFWTYPRAPGQGVDLMVSSSHIKQLRKHLESGNFTTETKIENVQELAEQQMAGASAPSEIWAVGLKPTMFDYGKYHTYEEILDWTRNITAAYPKITRLHELGVSFEGRTVNGIQISTAMKGNTPNATLRPALYFQSGMHAREWIAPATVMFMAATMLDKYGKDKNVTTILDTFDVFFVPLVNPDGYVYTWTSEPKARGWRKTRTKNTGTSCVGLDPNRNFPVKFAEKGASHNPCDDTYCGPFPFFAVEVLNVAKFLISQPGISFKGFIDFHSYSQLWMTPYAYTKELPPDYKVLIEGCQETIAALEAVYGTVYKCGSIANIINYLSSGSSADFTYAKLNITYSYGVELRDTGKHGFLLPADQIIPSGTETLAGLVTYGLFVKEKLQHPIKN
ncbi:carboxypeptidase B-like [Acanthaster planci]|uniref:Carboxypeptidase B-like n=1 Tax=Acanthaster planci TaxID=133434 RepID=A0A8B7Z0E3_ACAPL|nr:carboxypeptidase B-like [Acanthaster planci]XP_022099068.1 carboxypeptidase B-like [Acanthaster planci]